VSPHRRSLRPLAVALEDVRDELTPATTLAAVQRAWAEAVGPTIAAEATPTSERGGIVTVSCSASVWAHELDLMSPVILERLNGMLNGAAIARLRCVALPPREWS
jgi:predicted nucleic acid-binding Zn ribbon protein